MFCVRDVMPVCQSLEGHAGDVTTRQVLARRTRSSSSRRGRGSEM